MGLEMSRLKDKINELEGLVSKLNSTNTETVAELNDEIEELKAHIAEQDNELQMLNNDMYDLKVLTGQEVKEMKCSLLNTK
jgi:uncharacterized coiled-coil protein SlyX